MRVTRSFLLVFILLATVKTTFAQDNFIGYFMPTLKLGYNLNQKFSQNFEFENRNFTYTDSDFGLKAKHFELSHFSKFEFKPNHQFSLGIRYRVEALESEENELRFAQQYEWKKTKDAILEHRIRLEERIYKSETNFRLRYQTGYSFNPKEFCDEVSISNELTLETGEKNKPEYEERVLVEVNWDISPKSNFIVGSQYRLSNFTRDVEHNLFLMVGLGFEL